jgi:hypothetical protein
MKFPNALLLPALLLPACTSVKVHRLTEEKLPKVPARQVQLYSAEAAQQRPNTKLATIDMTTHSPFAANLNEVAHERAGKLGGTAYIVTSGSSQTTVTGGASSVFGDSTSSSMSIEVIRWKDTPLPTPKPKKGAKAEAPANAAPASAAPAPGKPAASTKPAPAASTPPPAKPPKTKAWWRPWSWF